MDEEFVASVIRHIKPGGVAFDIGANHGCYTRFMAPRFDAVYAFEPDEENLSILLGQTMEFMNVFVVPKAISNITGNCRLYRSDNNPGGHTIANKVASKEAWGHKKDLWMETPCITIDDFRKEMGSNSRVDFIKCDVEGAEEFIFEGAIETLKTCHPDIVMEVHQTVGLEDLYNWFHKLGYHWVDSKRNEVVSIKHDEHYLLLHDKG